MRAPRLAILVLISISCGDKGRPDPVGPTLPGPGSGSGSAAVAPTPPAPEPPLPPGVPDTVAGHQLAWVMDVIVARKGVTDVAEVERHFAPEFLAQVPADKAVGVFVQLAQAGIMTVSEAAADPSGNAVIARAAAGDAKLRITLAVDPKTTKIVGLLFAPDEDLSAKPTSFAQAEQLLPTLATKAQMLVAALDKGACKAIHKVKSSDQLAIGSTFKLYVLLGLADQIIAGKQSWDGEIAVKDEWKSLPSGVTQDDAAGTKLSVRTLAERMISISDNTATDHLLYTVGRKNVEAALTAAKHARAKLDVPFLSTRELFLFKLGMSAAEIDDYLALSASKRRTFLDSKLAGKKPTIDGVTEWKQARRIESLEWFASADDLCRVMATLATRAKNAKAAPLLEVLSKNPGLPVDKAKFPYVGFKGGSEPGVLNVTWLLRRDDDRWFVVSLGFNTPTGDGPDEGKVIGFAQGVLELLAAER